MSNKMSSIADQTLWSLPRTTVYLALSVIWISANIVNADEPRFRFEPMQSVSNLFVDVQGMRTTRHPTLLRWQGQDPVTVAPDAAMATDRPDVTEASSTVGAGVLQIESGYTYVRDRSDGDLSQSHSFPETLFRYGTPIDWLELRFAANASQVISPITTSLGVEDLYVGAKLGLTLQDGVFPEMALVPQMTIPTGATGLTSNKFLPGVNWL